MQKRIWPGWLVLLVATIVLVVDQTTKRWIERNLAIGESLVPFPALADTFTITHLTNTGAAFGLFRDQRALLMVIAAVVIVAIVVYARYLPHDRVAVQIALGLQLGGALGNNLFDRLRLGHVTDFLYFHNLPIVNRPWPAFNVADMAIVSGVALLALVLLREGDSSKPQPTAAEHGADEQQPA